MPHRLRQQITLLCDSHGRDLGLTLKSQVGCNVSVFNLFKPNAKFEGVIDDVGRLSATLGRGDKLIIIAGCNNIESDGLRNVNYHVSNIGENTSHTSVLLYHIPYRYDNPGLNSKIREVNHQLQEAAKKYKHIQVRNLNCITRKHYTSHGLHLSSYGKHILSQDIISQL